MQEEFRRIIPATSEKPETRVLEARALFDIYKRKVGQEEVTFSVSDLVMMDESFRGNQAFEEDRAWLREQLAGQFDSQNTESKLKIIGHLIDDDPQLAGQLIDKTSEQIKKHHRKLKGSANERDANWDKRQQAAKFERAIGGVVEKVSILEQREEIEDKFGYEHPLDETLTDKRNIVGGEYKRHKIRISHLRVPEVKDLGEVTPEAQWGEVTEFLKQVESPAKFLKRWSGKGIDKRKHFLSERVNEAYGVGVDVITQM
ncbi:MAG: hypothetical protein CMI58_06065, partial [Parcubacteria group bacterium]|nr:hypothetical protein [Parcubacteria group bacterium]